MRLKTTLAGLLAAAAVAAPTAMAAPAAHAPVAVAAKSCSGGFVHAVIGGSQKCLRRGEFCARRYDSQYRHYGYRCVKRDALGNYHLT